MKTVFFDVDTQIDFLYPSGALYVPGAEKIIPTIAKLNQGAPLLVSTVDAHAENDIEFNDYPPHCIAGTLGQRKPAALLRSDNNQFLFEKQTVDVFMAQGLPHLLMMLKADRYVVYGVVTEICVRFAALGLIRTGRQVDIVTDAIQALDQAKADAMLQEFQIMGGSLITSEQALARASAPPIGLANPGVLPVGMF